VTDELLAHVGGWGLPNGLVSAAEPFEVSRHLSKVIGDRLTGVLHAAMVAGDIEVDEPDAVSHAHKDAMAQVLLLEDVMLEAYESLRAVDIEVRLVKGSALAHLVGNDPSERVFGDTDLLVRGDQLPAAATVLENNSAVRIQPRVSELFERRFAKSVTLRWRADTELDLHRTLAPGPFGLMIDSDDLFAATNTSTVSIGGVDVATFGPELHLVHAAMHAALGDVTPRLGNVRDIALLLGRSDLSNDRVMALAAGWNAEVPLARGIVAATKLGAGRSGLTDWADQYRASSRDRRILACYGSREGRFRAQAWASLRVLPWRERPAFVRALTTRRGL